jgi:deltex-like protein
MSESEESLAKKLEMLIALGFDDEFENRSALFKFDYNLDNTVNYLFDEQIQRQNQEDSKAGLTNVPSSTTLIDLTLDNSSTILPAPLLPTVIKQEARGDLAHFPKGELDQAILAWALENDLDFLNEHQTAQQKQEDEELKTTQLPPPQLIPLDVDDDEDCTICYNSYPSTDSSSWKTLQCSHKVCTGCYAQIEITRTTMSGLTHTGVKCPFCQGMSGIEIGTCPNGVMTVSQLPSACDGYPGFGTISISYFISDPKYPLNRIAYIPNTPKGKKILALLRTAWDRRLCFTIGTSVTTGTENSVVWNIHHKTAMKGGVQAHGYPDPGYLERVLLELKACGIE